MELGSRMKLTRAASAIAAVMLLSVGWAAGTAGAAAPGYYTAQKVVYHNDGGAPDNAAYFRRMLNTIRNHLEAVGRDNIEIRVVDHADGIELFRIANADKDLAGRLDALRSAGVRFLICANTLRERGIDWHGLYGVQEADIVPSGAAELARLQGMGYVYIHL